MISVQSPYFGLVSNSCIKIAHWLRGSFGRWKWSDILWKYNFIYFIYETYHIYQTHIDIYDYISNKKKKKICNLQCTSTFVIVVYAAIIISQSCFLWTGAYSFKDRSTYLISGCWWYCQISCYMKQWFLGALIDLNYFMHQIQKGFIIQRIIGGRNFIFSLFTQRPRDFDRLYGLLRMQDYCLWFKSLSYKWPR